MVHVNATLRPTVRSGSCRPPVLRLPPSRPAAFLAVALFVALSSLFSGHAAADTASDAALAEAEASVAEARAKQALWTAAVQALDAARKAQQRGDADECRRQSRLATDLARLGILQAEGGTGPR